MLIKVFATPNEDSLLSQGKFGKMSDKALNMLRHFNEIELAVEVNAETGLVDSAKVIGHYEANKQ